MAEPKEAEDWVRLRVEAVGFVEGEMPGPHNLVLLHVGGLSIAPAETRIPHVIALFTTSFIPHEGNRIRHGEEHYLVMGIEYRTDLGCIVALVQSNPMPTQGMGRYFFDGRTLRF